MGKEVGVPVESLNPLSVLLNNVLQFISGLAGAGFTIAFIIYGFKLAGSASNPAARANSITGLWWTGLGAIISFGAPFIIRMLQDIADEVGAPLDVLIVLLAMG